MISTSTIFFMKSRGYVAFIGISLQNVQFSGSGRGFIAIRVTRGIHSLLRGKICSGEEARLSCFPLFLHVVRNDSRPKLISPLINSVEHI